MRNKEKQSVCEWAQVTPQSPAPGSKIGIALDSLQNEPINGLRLNPEKGTNGWYIWGGAEFPKEDDAFSPLHIEHIGDYLPIVTEYLNLPPGYRFLVDSDSYEDVWYDQELLNT